MWKRYLNGQNVTGSDYAVPMLHETLSDLPKTYVEVAEVDILCDQGAAYSEKMQQAGVDVTLQSVPGAYHGYDGDVHNTFVRRMLDTRIAWLGSVLP